MTRIGDLSTGFYSLRVYALDGRYGTAGLVLLLNLVPFATNLVGAATI